MTKRAAAWWWGAALSAAFGLSGSCYAIDVADHLEFEAQIAAPYRADTTGRRDFALQFRFPGAETGTGAVWRVDILDPQDQVVRTWRGQTRLVNGSSDEHLSWYEHDLQNGLLTAGIYSVRLTATTLDAGKLGVIQLGALDPHIDAVLALRGAEIQSWPIQIGNVAKPVMPAFAALPFAAQTVSKILKPSSSSASGVGTQAVAAPASLPYTVYLGNLHSQTNHSDGGGPLSTCTSEQTPQTGVGGPADAYAYALGRGLDFLMTSEHNHMFDGSTGTNTSQTPAFAHNLYQSGLSAATTFNSAHSNFLGVYGMEWGVINNGGHLNIFNSPSLLEWEYNSSNQLIGDIFSPKGDYGALYTQMKTNGWIGQFNHPATTGQFNVGGTDLAYTADGDQVMVTCEVMNSSAFSSNTTETETGLNSYEAACNKILEAGYHVAFSTDQDNHCANWGASYTNRNGVLIPNGTALTTASFIDALRARRVFATTDKTSQLVLTANGHLMGETFSNSGSLTLTANYAPGAGRSATQVQIFQGVPGSNGTVTVLSTTATTTITPTTGAHFYYAKITQDNGKLLWSAPVWVNQGAGTGDTTPPTVSATETGTSGTITLAATASDNVGVTRVEFSIDGTLVATDTATPYSSTYSSTSLANGSHSLVARAYDAANNVGTSSTVTFTISNTTADTTPPTVSATETGTSGTITLAATASDNVGVTRVEFSIDGTLVATDTATPYSSTYNSTALSNGSHSLVARAYDAAGNVGTSSTVTFSISNTVTAVQLVSNGGFESGVTNWTASTGVITNSASEAAHAGTYKAWLDGYGTTTTDTLLQSVAIPSTATTVTFSFYLHIDTAETTTATAYDKLTVQVRNSSGTVLATLATYSNLNAATGYTQRSFSLAAYKGQTVQLFFSGVEDSQLQTSFVIDDVSVLSQ